MGAVGWILVGVLFGLALSSLIPTRTVHYEISPREREDEAVRDERDFGTQEYDDEADKSEPRVWGDSAES